MTKEELLNIVKFDDKGLIPVIAQDYHSKHIRMLAYMKKPYTFFRILFDGSRNVPDTLGNKKEAS